MNFRYIFNYGCNSTWINVTNLVYNQHLYKTNVPRTFKIILPKNDYIRCKIFKADPCYNQLKCIHVIDTLKKLEKYYPQNEYIVLYTNEDICLDIGFHKYCLDSDLVKFYYNFLTSNIQIKYGSLDTELPEQLLSVKFISPDMKVLELGTNIGRNSMIISSLLENQNNLITLEVSQEYYNQAIENKIINNMTFNIENCALSTKNVFQKGWFSISTDDDNYQDWTKVPTITFDQLQKKYNIIFDTLVLDCEGAFYSILLEMPHILDNIYLIIIENDFDTIEQYSFLYNLLINKNFYCSHQEPLTSGLQKTCMMWFYEVWSRN